MKQILKTIKDSIYFSPAYNLRKLFASSILLLSLLQVVVRIYEITIYGGHNWGTGEWLINYSGGFIRRGMVGSIVLLVSQSQPYVLFFLFALQISFIVVVFAFFFFALHKFKFTWSSIALFCSPFSITFIGWDQYVFARKELMGLVTLIIIASIKLLKLKSTGNVVGLALILFTVAVFSSEVNLVFIPAVIYLLFVVYSNAVTTRFWISTSAFSIVTLSAFFTSVFFSGDKIKANKICQKVIDSGLNPNQNCDGSIRMMGESPDAFFSLILDAFPQYLIYMFVLLLALLPILSAGWHKQNNYWFLVICMCTGSLFLLALDYGRNIFIMASALTICIATTTSSLNQKWGAWTVIFFVTFIGTGHGGNPISNGWIAAFPSTVRFAQQYLFS